MGSSRPLSTSSASVRKYVCACSSAYAGECVSDPHTLSWFYYTVCVYALVCLCVYAVGTHRKEGERLFERKEAS